MSYYLEDIRRICYLCRHRAASHRICRSGTDQLGYVCEPCGTRECKRLNKEQEEKTRNGIKNPMDR